MDLVAVDPGCVAQVSTGKTQWQMPVLPTAPPSNLESETAIPQVCAAAQK